MNVRLVLLEIYLPAFLKRRKLQELMRCTAAACGATPPPGPERSYRRLWSAFAEFTYKLAAAAEPEKIRQQLRLVGYNMGRQLRRELGVRSWAEARRALRLIYRALDIDLHMAPNGAVLVRACSFSRIYSAATCRLMSAMDEGLMAGVSGRKQLHFRERLTTGAACCRAELSFPDGQECDKNAQT